jgi:DNA-binding transcriptional LysR family regulator
MLDLKDVFYFVQVVDHGGFTSAGRVLRLPKSTLSHRVRELESYLNIRLLNRTSRQLSLTEVGQEFYRHGQEMLRVSQSAEEAIGQRLTEPSGVIRITTAIEISQFALCHLIPAFLNRYPKVQIVEVATDQLVDIVADGFDIALRGHVAPLQNSTLIQRHVADVPWYLFAGSEYLERAGLPSGPEDLARHASLSLLRDGAATWNLRDPEGSTVTVPLEPRFRTNNMVSLKEAACANLGIAALPGYICRAELKSGALRPVLPGWIASDARMSTLVPYRGGILPAVRALLDFAAAELPAITAFTPFDPSA